MCMFIPFAQFFHRCTIRQKCAEYLIKLVAIWNWKINKIIIAYMREPNDVRHFNQFWNVRVRRKYFANVKWQWDKYSSVLMIPSPIPTYQQPSLSHHKTFVIFPWYQRQSQWYRCGYIIGNFFNISNKRNILPDGNITNNFRLGGGEDEI